MIEDLGTFVGNIMKRLGWLLVLAGLIPVGVHAYDVATTEQAIARVVALDAYCKPQSCSKCRYRRSTCAAAEADPQLAAGLKRREYVRVQFTTSSGRAVSSRATLARLGIRSANVGDVLRVSYSRSRPKSVGPVEESDSWKLGFIALAAGAGLLGVRSVGGLLLGAGHSRRRRQNDKGTERRQPERHVREHPSSNQPVVVGEVSSAWGAARPAPAVKPETAKPHVPKVAIPMRVHKQGRNRGIF